MAGTASHSQAGFLLRALRDRNAWIRTADVVAVLLALSLPWSTSLVAIFAVAFVVCLIPAFDKNLFLQSLKRPASIAPVALFALAVIGMAWASDIPWAARLHGFGPVAKLLLIPLLIYQIERSGRGLWIVAAFVLSCSVVMVLSWYLYFAGFTWSYWPGVPVKNYIAQSQEFTFCIFALFGAVILLLEKGETKIAYGLAALAAIFTANLLFVVSSRTALICAPILLTVFAFRHFSRNGVLLTLLLACVAAAVAWTMSPELRTRVSYGFGELKGYEEQNLPTSTGLRLEYWKKSMKFIEAAPLFGNGTGSIRTLFERDAVGKTGASAEVIGNPHNQTLNVAVQWGLLGVVALYVMWVVHLRLFATADSFAGWIGLVAVVENIASSIFNSHLFDFTEGWLYVLAIGIAGGMVFRGGKQPAGWALR
ncbi:MAG: O-antigen ligase family protein [Rhizobiales bacterium]|nr:O-antigen ligase family protein [Hyphomicrobiales bacterium]